MCVLRVDAYGLAVLTDHDALARGFGAIDPRRKCRRREPQPSHNIKCATTSNTNGMGLCRLTAGQTWATGWGLDETRP